MGKGLVLVGVIGALLLARARQYEWDGRVAVIVGGSRGLGLLVARRVGRKGAIPVLVARNEAELLAAQHGLADEGIRAEVIVADVSDEEQAFAAIDRIAARMGRLDVLVNAASIIPVGPFEALTIDDLRAAVDVNFWGTVFTCWAALPHLKKARGARIANVSSIGGEVSVPHLLPYSCGKFAVTGFSEGLQAEVARHGIRVVTIVPWLMRTGSAPHALVKGRKKVEAALFEISASLPLLTVDAGRAADRIVKAIEKGERHVTIGVLAKGARIARALAPGLSGAVLGLAARLLPRAPRGSAEEVPTEARQQPSMATRSPLTRLGRSAAAHNNETFAGPPAR
ncbi:MAG TPA: SDR family oxidoreductase [Vulgatibacter sp.]